METEHAILLEKLKLAASFLGEESMHDHEETMYHAIQAIEDLSAEISLLEDEVAYTDFYTE